MAANLFKNAFAKDVGTSPSTIYAAPSSQRSILIELDVCNTTNSGVTVDVYLSSGGTNYYLVKNTPVPVGGSLQIVAGQKIVLYNTDAIKIVSSAAASIDVVAAVLEDC